MLKFIVLLLASSAFSLEEVDFLSDEFIDSINSRQNSWVAGRNFPKDTPIEYFRSLSCIPDDADKHNHIDVPRKNFTIEELRNVPDEFDARIEWPQCETVINDIRDQGTCGSCWAKAAAAVMTDRWCIHSNIHNYFSSEDIVTCSKGGSCTGGYPSEAFVFWMREGVVTGGKGGSDEGCKPYRLSTAGADTPLCNPQCQPGYDSLYWDDKRFANDVYELIGEDAMKADIYENGPIVVTMVIYEDFQAYKSGVYSHTSGEQIGLHAMKVFGWGQENGKDYWLVANSWGTGFGDGGFVKVLRGKDECGIEGVSSTAMPRFG